MTSTMWRGCRAKAGLSGRLLVGLLVVSASACGSSEPPLTGSVTVPGEPGTAVAAHDVPDGESVPDGVELAEVRLSVDADTLRVRFVQADDAWASVVAGELARPPVWSLSLWSGGEEDELVPSYWIAATWLGPRGAVSLPAEMAVWLCPREAFPDGAGRTMESRGAEGDSSTRSTPCGRRSASGRAVATATHIDVRVPRSEFEGLRAPLAWAAVSTASRSPGTVGWSHCAPACAQGDWSFPPVESRAVLDGA